jgi:hypothetical protein
MSDRKPLSKKIRFEVFKRDKFQCQYCGRKAPEVLLRCDHIKPVSLGGESDILNLITACFDCNAGKSNRELSDVSIVERQRDQLAELEDRRQQIEMMIEWRDSLTRIAQDFVGKAEGLIERLSGSGLSVHGKLRLSKWCQRFDPDAVYQAIERSFIAYREVGGDGKITDDSFELAFSKIPAFIALLKQEVEKPYIGQLAYIQGILRRRCRNRGIQCVAYLEHVHLNGMSIEELETRAKQARSFDSFYKPIDEWLESIGQPW